MPTPVEPPSSSPAQPELIEYTGVVEEAYSGPDATDGVPGAWITILGGTVDGRTAVTDAEGRFSFPDYPRCELDSPECLARRFRVEKQGYETLEVEVNDPYWLRFRKDTFVHSDEYKRIVIGHEWPADPLHPRFERMRQRVRAMDRLWYIRLAEPHPRNYSGTYVGGVIVIFPGGPVWDTIVHEYCHAHQDWAASPDYYDVYEWEQSPEGQAYIEALAADRAAGYTHPHWTIRGDPLEDAANVCAAYAYGALDNLTRDNLRRQAPNRFRWAEEWLYRQ